MSEPIDCDEIIGDEDDCVNTTNATECKKYSDVTYSQSIVTKLNPEEWFTKLMELSTGSDSIYIKAKETMLEYFASEGNTLTSREQSEMLVKLVGDMTTSMTKSSLDTAYAIVLADRDGPFTLTKIQEDTLGLQESRDKMAADNCNVGSDKELKGAQRDKMVIDGWAVQARMSRDDGFDPFTLTMTNVVLPATIEQTDGTKYFNTKQIQSSINATYAKSFRDSGYVTYTQSTDGKVTTIGNGTTTTTDTAVYGLTYAQTGVAIRQTKGFDDNMLQHAANAAGGMIGVMIGSGASSAIPACYTDALGKALCELTKDATQCCSTTELDPTTPCTP